MHSVNIPCPEAFARMDTLAETLATLRVLAGCYEENPAEGRHLVKYLLAALNGAVADITVMAENREVANG